MRSSRKCLSLLSELSKPKTQDISQEIIGKPTVTGGGPFAELPQFNSLGDPSHLLNITIPQSAALNIRNGALVAINGDLTDLSSQKRTLPSGIPYQNLRSNSPVSLIVNGNNHTYSIIEVAKDEKWTILKDESLVAWSGYSLELHPHQLLQKSKSLQTTGKGTLVVSGSNKLFEVTLQDGEQILINPNSVVASSNNLHFQILNYKRWNSVWKNYTHSISRAASMLSFSLPRSGFMGSLAINLDKLRSFWHTQYSSLRHSLLSVKELQSLTRALSKTKRLVYNTMLNFMLRFRPIFFSVNGPAKLLIKSDRQLPNSAIFTREEIRSVFHASRGN